MSITTHEATTNYADMHDILTAAKTRDDAGDMCHVVIDLDGSRWIVTPDGALAEFNLLAPGEPFAVIAVCDTVAEAVAVRDEVTR